MRAARRIFAAAALASLCFAPPALGVSSAKESYVVAGWLVESVVDPETGTFEYCNVESDYENGVTLIFSRLATGETLLGLFNPDWRLDEGGVYALRLWVDEKRPVEVDGEAVTSKGLVILPPNPAELVQRLRQGRQMQIEAANKILRFDLYGSSRALAELANCVKRNARGGGSRSNPFAGAPAKAANPFAAGNAASSSDTTQLAAEARNLARMIFAQAQVTDYRFSDIAIDEKVGGAAWMTPKVVGFVMIMEDVETADRAARILLAGEAEACRGSLDSHRHDSEADEARFYADCVEESGTTTTHFTVAPRKHGGVYAISMYGRRKAALHGTAAAALKLNAKIWSAVDALRGAP